NVVPPLSLRRFVAANTRRTLDGRQLSLEEIPLVRALRYGEVICQREILLERSDGRSVTCLVNAAPLFLNRGKQLGAIAVFQDITSRASELRLREELFTFVSHELRTPLTVVEGIAQLLVTNWEELAVEERATLLRDLLTAARSLRDMLERMLQLAELQKAGTQQMRISTPVIELVSAVLRELADELAPFQVVLQIPPDLTVDTVPLHVVQALRSVIHNAAKYSPPGERIEIEAYREGTEVRIQIRDYAPGVEPELQSHLFQPFQRGRSHGKPGLGLGLYQAKILVEASGGRIWYEAPTGKGAVFVLAFPERLSGTTDQSDAPISHVIG
ncbi:MAG: ATP-binding protein, partial [Thermomicrobium sp.]